VRDRDSDALIWAMFFASNASFCLFHPGNAVRSMETPDKVKRSIDLCAKIADTQFDLFARRFRSELFKED
jgi:hypothetical protein